MERLPEELISKIREYRPVHPTARVMRAFIERLRWEPCNPLAERLCGCCEDSTWCRDCEGFAGFAIHDYRAEPDWFDGPYGDRAMTRRFYRWGSDNFWTGRPDICDPRLHGGRL